MGPGLRVLWARFRRLAGWAQLTLGVSLAVIVVSAFASEAAPAGSADRVAVTFAGPTSTTVVTPTTVVARTTSPPVAPVPAAGALGPVAGEDSSVVRVIDGDTIVVTGGTRVRLVGIDSPETVDPGRPVQCFGPEATRYATELLPIGTRIRLVYDVERLDRYGRTLAYVYKVSDGVFVNLAIARNGFASQLTVPPDVAHAEEFRVAAAQARTAGLGLWGACQSTATPTTRAVPSTSPPTSPPSPTNVARTPTTAATAGGGCHPSYAGACVPVGFSDVDCAGGSGNGPGYVSARNFRVVGPDEYRLDADGDGIACESG